MQKRTPSPKIKGREKIRPPKLHLSVNHLPLLLLLALKQRLEHVLRLGSHHQLHTVAAPAAATAIFNGLDLAPAAAGPVAAFAVRDAFWGVVSSAVAVVAAGAVAAVTALGAF